MISGRQVNEIRYHKGGKFYVFRYGANELSAVTLTIHLCDLARCPNEPFDQADAQFIAGVIGRQMAAEELTCRD